MNKPGKAAKSRDEQKILDFLKSFAESVISEHSVDTVAGKIEVSPEAVNQMRLYAKGSTIPWIKLFTFAFRVPISALPGLARKARGEIGRLGEREALESLVDKARLLYSERELCAWLQLLLARHDIEKNFGLRNAPVATKMPGSKKRIG